MQYHSTYTLTYQSTYISYIRLLIIEMLEQINFIRKFDLQNEFHDFLRLLNHLN